MIISKLTDTVLVTPAKNGATSLYIVSGYAAATMAYYQMEQLKRLKPIPHIKLIIGMCASEGISKSNHLAFQRLVTKDFPKKFECRYLKKTPPVHSKVYTWLKNDDPFIGFIGSANYTQNGFGNSQREVMAENEPSDGLSYFSSLYGETIDCIDPKIENYIEVFDDSKRKSSQKKKTIIQTKGAPIDDNLLGLPRVTVSFLDKHGELPQISGLNWAQSERKEYREPNQAYIRLTSNIYKTDFFPKVGVRFTILTDDNEIFVCSRAQANGKAIHTPENNSLFGKYFRKRLGVPLGQPVKTIHLLKYGRTSVDFYKIDDEAYFMDFSAKQHG